MTKQKIESESKFVWKTIFQILLIPIILIQILFRRKRLDDILNPFKLFFDFLFQAKFVIIIIIINIIIFICSLFADQNFILKFINYPSDLFSLKFYTLLTAGFLHANLTHLLFNMLALFIFGRVVERKMGSLKTAFIYFGALIISGMFSSLINLLILKDNTPGLGASGAIMGLVSTAILLNPFYITYEMLIPLPIMVVGWFTIFADIMGILNPTEDGIGHFAHLGGFLSIGILIYLLSSENKKELKKGFIINIISILIFGLAYYFFLKRFISL